MWTVPPPAEEAAGLSDIGRAASSRRGDDDDLGGATAENINIDDEEVAIIGDDGGGGIPDWKERIDVSIARSRRVRGSNYVQISTIDVGAMEPRCRTVVFRGFLRGVPPAALGDALLGGRTSSSDRNGGDASFLGSYGDCVMKMITDSRSNKVREASSADAERKTKKNDVAELVWWFPKSSEQYRVRGRLRFVGGNDDEPGYFANERRQQWGNLSDMAREQFYWSDPGTAYSGKIDVPAGGRDDKDGKVLPPPHNFLLMLLCPTRVDYLRLTDNYRQVDEWSRDSHKGWKSIRVNP